jgi:hypothetical protein
LLPIYKFAFPQEKEYAIGRREERNLLDLFPET